MKHHLRCCVMFLHSSLRLLGALVILLVSGGGLALAGQIDIVVEPASFTERIQGPWAREMEGDNVIEGDNTIRPESIAFSDTKVFEPDGSMHHAGLLAQTISYGPVSQVFGVMHSITSDDPRAGLTWSSAQLSATTEYDVAIYNRTETSEPMWVPVIIDAYLSATLSLRYHGITGGTRPLYFTTFRNLALARITMSREDYRGEPYEFREVEEVRLLLTEPGTGESPLPEARALPFSRATLIWVGQFEGSVTRFTVVHNVAAELGTGTYVGLNDIDNYCEMFAFAQVDPEIYIDPSWEHADKFGLVLPENLTMTPLPLPRLITPVREPNGDVLLHWIGDGVLQESLTIGDSISWVDSANQSTPQSITPDAYSRFYRVIARP